MFLTLDDQRRADWSLLQTGAVSLFWKKTVLDLVERDLERLGYEVLTVRCDDAGEFHRQVSDALKWVEQFGYSPWTGNLDALNDGLRHFPFGPSKCAALRIEGFDQLWAADQPTAFAFLDMFEDASRTHLLHGCRLIGLVQTDDPEFRCDPLGGRQPQWNPAEWLDSRRERR